MKVGTFLEKNKSYKRKNATALTLLDNIENQFLKNNSIKLKSQKFPAEEVYTWNFPYDVWMINLKILEIFRLILIIRNQIRCNKK